MYQHCYFNLTAWDHTALLILPERSFHIFEFKSETLKSLTKTLSQWCFLSLCQFDLKCSGQVAFLSMISYRGTQFSHIFLIASLETPPSPCLSILSPSLGRNTSCCLFTASPCPGHYAKSTYRAFEMRVQATAVNQGRSAASRYCRFCAQLCNWAGRWCWWPCSSSNQRWINQGEDTTSRGVKTEGPLLIYGRVRDIITGCSSWFSSNSQQGNKEGDFS